MKSSISCNTFLGDLSKYVLVSGLVFSLVSPDVWASGTTLGGGEGAIATVLENLLMLMTGRIAKIFGILTIVICGYLAYLGALTGRTAINVALAIGIIFGARQIGGFLMGGF